MVTNLGNGPVFTAPRRPGPHMGDNRSGEVRDEEYAPYRRQPLFKGYILLRIFISLFCYLSINHFVIAHLSDVSNTSGSQC